MMHTPEADDLAYFPNGDLNGSYILANANILLREGEYRGAASLYRLLKGHRTFGHCAHYGLGKCFYAAKDYTRAILSYESALAISRRPYIATALLEALAAQQDYDAVEKRAVEFAREFVHHAQCLQDVRNIYQRVVSVRANSGS